MHRHFASSLLLIALTCCLSAYGATQENNSPSGTSNEPQATSTTINNGSPTATSSPDEFNDVIDIALNGTIYPPTIFSGGATIPKDLTITCLDCGINANISLSAGGSIAGDQISTPSDVSKLAPPAFNFKDYWVGATFDSLTADFEFAVNVSASNPNNELIIPINVTTMTRTYDFLTLTAILTTEIHASINTTTEVNFTYGYKFSVPSGSEILVDLEHINKSVSVGFNASTLTPTTFNTTTPSPDLSLSLSFRPAITFIASIGALGAHAAVQLTTTLDIPQLTANISQIHNATSSCLPPAASLPSNQIYQNLTLIQPFLNVDASEVFSETGKIPGLKLEADQPFSQASSPRPLDKVCLLFDPAVGSLGAAPVTRPADVPSMAVGLGKTGGVACGWVAGALIVVAVVNMGL